jgi:sec-independent protein translocase protein TatC
MADDPEARTDAPAGADDVTRPITIPAPATPEPTAPAPGPPGEPSRGEEAVMSLVDHLGELRTRIFRALLAVFAGSVVGFYFADELIELLAAPAGGRLLNLAPGDAFAIYLRVSLIVGIVLAMPVILYQVWAFVAPGLTPNERRIVRPWVPLALAFFALGVAVAWVVLPFALGFLLSFGTGTFVNQLAAAPYFNFVTTMFLAFGLVMEFPIVLFALSRVGVVSSARLRASRRYALLGVTVFAAVVTPGGDIVSPIVLGATMYLLFEGTIWFIARTGR